MSITLSCIVFWIATPVPPWFTGLLGIGLIGLVFSPELALDGFAEPVLWLIVFGLIVGEGIHRSKLPQAIENWLLAWTATGVEERSVVSCENQPCFAKTNEQNKCTPNFEGADPVRIYQRLLIIFCFGGLLFAVMVPSSLVRVLILAPILLEIGSMFDSRRARLGLFFGPLFATFYGSVGILTAFLPNIVIIGIVDSLTEGAVKRSPF
ncbi:transporter permease [Halorubrum vacuolatum]|uniref:anion permease n=1 Tax=Halorubrum vacuolatum TaxID=63740 RepID=UPI00117AB233|nr:anion permease [Halorubrum vacuolatum]